MRKQPFKYEQIYHGGVKDLVMKRGDRAARGVYQILEQSSRIL